MKKLLVVVVGIFLGVSILVLPAQGRSRLATPSWLQYRGDSSRSGFNPNETQITPSTAAGLFPVRPVFYFPYDGPTPPLIYRNTLYSVSMSFSFADTGEDEATVYAIDTSTGRLKWSRAFACVTRVDEMPAISTAAHVLVVGLRAGCTSQTGSGKFFGLDLSTGATRWQVSAATSPGTSAIVGSDIYIVMCEGAGGCALASFDAYTGVQRWFVEGDFSFAGFPSVADGIVYLREWVDGFDGPPELTAIDASTGARLWTAGSATSNPTLGAGRVFVDCDLGMVCSYDRYGHLKWHFAGTGEIVYGNGTVFVACPGQGGVCELDWKTGTLLRAIQVDGSISSLTVGGGVIYATVDSGTFGAVFCLDAATGDQLNRLSIKTTDPVLLNGHLYLVDENRIVVYGLTR